MGEMDYGEDEALHFVAAYYPERHDCSTEFHLISAQRKSAENDHPVKKLTAEARFVARRIRQLPRPDAKTIPIVAISANAFDEDIRRSLASGMSRRPAALPRLPTATHR